MQSVCGLASAVALATDGSIRLKKLLDHRPSRLHSQDVVSLVLLKWAPRGLSMLHRQLGASRAVVAFLIFVALHGKAGKRMDFDIFHHPPQQILTLPTLRIEKPPQHTIFTPLSWSLQTKRKQSRCLTRSAGCWSTLAWAKCDASRLAR